MDSFYNSFDIESIKPTIQLGDSLIFVGSCFSDEISNRASKSGLSVTANPFGTVFHPLSIFKSISDAIHDEQGVAICQKDDLFFHWHSSGKIYGLTQESLREKIHDKRSFLKNELKKASHLFLTFGTARGHYLKNEKLPVANCHKMPRSLFDEKLASMEEIVSNFKVLYQELKNLNSSLQLVLTVSPVRHLRDGFIENNRSKARLLLACEEMSKLNDVHYFPVYEWVVDSLRDYRFFKEDGIHPNEQAVNFIWKKMQSCFFDKETVAVMQDVHRIYQGLNHQILYPESEQAKKHQQAMKSQLEKLANAHPTICWDSILGKNQ